jgi:hypothetical protein
MVMGGLSVASAGDNEHAATGFRNTKFRRSAGRLRCLQSGGGPDISSAAYGYG